MKLISCHHKKKSRHRPGAAATATAAAAAAAATTTTSTTTITNTYTRRGDHRIITIKLAVGKLFALCLMILVLAAENVQIQDQYDNNNDSNGPLSSSSWLLLVSANSDANRLYEDLMMTYNRIVRPVQNNSDRVVVRLGLKLSQLMDVNLKNQMMTINVWLNQEWSDHKLKWDPSEYGGIEDINLPAEQIWLPDIALYNSAEGYFAVSIMTKAKVHHDGRVVWNPPAIFRSSCQIDITYFPFDSQNCHLKFGSWTFGNKLDLRHINDTEGTIERGTDLSEYYQNVEWDIMKASARRNVITYICCPNDFYPDLTFNFTLRRKPLFYTVNLILPCIGITFFSFLVFYLPSDSGEKVTLTISILVSLIFFLSVLIETIPSTSLAMPLLGKYLVFTMILITLSVCATVCVLNIHFRTPSTHSMPPWIKRWCMDILPRYLFMSVPQYQSQQVGGSGGGGGGGSVLPEQLIYLHNQAYATQAVGLPMELSAAALAAAAAAAEASSHRPEGQDAGMSNQTRQQMASGAGGGGNRAQLTTAPMSQGELLRHQHQQLRQQASGATTTTTSSSSNRRPQVNAAKQAAPPQPSNQQQQHLKLNLNQVNQSGLFLPYLQSDTARRLQLQRSRSSERDRSTTSDNQYTSAAAAAASFNGAASKAAQTRGGPQLACDSKTTTSISGSTSAGAGRTAQAQLRTASKAGQDGQAKRQAEKQQQPGRPSAGKQKQSFPWNIFKSGQSQMGATSDNVEEQQQHQQQQHQAPVAAGPRRPRASTASTSSSLFDPNDDYQHHKHFQARASICSNNLWRIGPTRRCSLAVPPNYPTYYRPLAQLAHQQHHQHPHQGACSTSILSGQLPVSLHYHVRDETTTSAASNSTGNTLSPAINSNNNNNHNNRINQDELARQRAAGTTSEAIGSLVAASAASLLSGRNGQPPGNNNSNNSSGKPEMGPITSGGFIRIGVQLPPTVGAIPPTRRQTQDEPDYPSSVDDDDDADDCANHDRQATQNNLATGPSAHQQQQQFPPPPPSLEFISQQQQQQARRPTGNTTAGGPIYHKQPHLLVVDRPPRAGQVASNCSPRGEQQQQQRQGDRPVGSPTPAAFKLYASSSGSGSGGSGGGLQPAAGQALPSRQHGPQPAGIPRSISSGANEAGQQRLLIAGLQHQHQQQQHRAMAAAAYWDERKRQSGGGQLQLQRSLQSQQLQLSPANLSTSSSAMMVAPPPPPPLPLTGALPQSASISYSLNSRPAPPTLPISRAIGQAYSQKLQRQPTIYSLHNFVATPTGDYYNHSQQQQPHHLMSNSTAVNCIPLELHPLRGGATLRGHHQQQLAPGDGPRRHHQLPGIDMMRRSKSQTSLSGASRRAALHQLHSEAAAAAAASSVNYLHQHHPDLLAAHLPFTRGATTDHQMQLPPAPPRRPRSETRGRLNSIGGGGGGSRCCDWLECPAPTVGPGGNTMRSRNSNSRQQSRQCSRETCAVGRLQDVVGSSANCNINNHNKTTDSATNIPQDGPLLAGKLCSCNQQQQHHHHQQQQKQQQQGSSTRVLASNNNITTRTTTPTPTPAPQLTGLDLIKLVNEVEKAIQNAMFIAQHIDNLDEFESVKENWKYIAMVIDRIFLIIFLFACIVGTIAIFALVPWSNYLTDKPIDLQLTRLMALNMTAGVEPYAKMCQEL